MTKKKCIKGKSCKSTCINGQETCQVSLSAAASKSVDNLQVEIVKTVWLDGDEWDAISAYGYNAYKIWNEDLRNQGEVTRKAKLHKSFASAINKIPPTPNAKLTRLEYYNADDEKAQKRVKELARVKPGDVISDPAYASYTSGWGELSSIEKRLEDVPSVRARRRGSTGTQSVVVFRYQGSGSKSIDKYSTTVEEESLLPPGHRTRVVAKEEKPRDDTGEKVITITLEDA